MPTQGIRYLKLPIAINHLTVEKNDIKIIVMKRINLSILLIAVSLLVNAQFKLSGKVTDVNGEPLIGASVQLKGTFLGVSTNQYGEFMLMNIKQGEYEIIVKYLGYKTMQQKVTIQGTPFNIVLYTYTSNSVYHSKKNNEEFNDIELIEGKFNKPSQFSRTQLHTTLQRLTIRYPKLRFCIEQSTKYHDTKYIIAYEK